MLALTWKCLVVVFVFNIYIIEECKSQPIFAEFWKALQNDMQHKQEKRSFDFFEALFGDMFDYDDSSAENDQDKFLICKNCSVLLHKENEALPSAPNPNGNGSDSAQLVSALTQALQMFAEMSKIPAKPQPEEAVDASKVPEMAATNPDPPAKPAETMPTQDVPPT